MTTVSRQKAQNLLRTVAQNRNQDSVLFLQHILMRLRESFDGVYDPLSLQFQDSDAAREHDPYPWMSFPADLIAICWELEHIHPVVRTQKSRLTSTQKQALYDLLLQTDLSEHSDPNTYWYTPFAPPTVLEIANLAITGEQEDEIPIFMSQVLGNWIDFSQYRVPGKIQNTKKWKKLLVQAFGTDNNLECQRLQTLMDWMWKDVLPFGQFSADKGGFGDNWRTMLALKSERAADIPSRFSDSDDSAGCAYMAAFYAMRAARDADQFVHNFNDHSQIHWLNSTLHDIREVCCYIEDACKLDRIPFLNRLDWYSTMKRLIASSNY